MTTFSTYSTEGPIQWDEQEIKSRILRKYSNRGHDTISAINKSQLYFYTYAQTPLLKRYHLK